MMGQDTLYAGHRHRGPCSDAGFPYMSSVYPRSALIGREQSQSLLFRAPWPLIPPCEVGERNGQPGVPPANQRERVAWTGASVDSMSFKEVKRVPLRSIHSFPYAQTNRKLADPPPETTRTREQFQNMGYPQTRFNGET